MESNQPNTAPDPRWPGVRDPAAISFRSGPAPPKARTWLNTGLLLATFATLALAGGSFWEMHRWVDSEQPIALSEILLAGLTYATCLILILGAHEMGHYLACRRYEIPATLPFFIPGIIPFGTFGAVIRIRGRIPDRRALFDVAAAGPIAGFLVAVPILALGVLQADSFVPLPDEAGGMQWNFGEPLLMEMLRLLTGREGILQANSLIGAGWLGLLVTSLNLFPVGQLDGGHVVYALNRRWHRPAAFATIVGLFGVIAAQVILYRQVPTYLLWFAILLWMRDRHPRLVDERKELGPGRVILAIALLAIFVVSFMPMPITIVGG